MASEPRALRPEAAKLPGAADVLTALHLKGRSFSDLATGQAQGDVQA